MTNNFSFFVNAKKHTCEHEREITECDFCSQSLKHSPYAYSRHIDPELSPKKLPLSYRPPCSTHYIAMNLDGLHTSTLTPMHLRKAKLMFFYVRYPSSSILKMYFPDVKFNKNNTAQLIKWFSNFRSVEWFLTFLAFLDHLLVQGCPLF